MDWIQGLASAGLVLWLAILLLPWRPWSTRESLDSDAKPSHPDLSDITVLIPARNEASVIARTLMALSTQGAGLRIIVIDDQSSDATALIVEKLSLANVRLVRGEPSPPDWSGKLWALEQGRRLAETELLLLLDADIEVSVNLLATLKRKLLSEDLHLLSLMARLRMTAFWERLLIPAFIYFFKLLYPFHLSNRNSKWIAAAAGGCILLRNNSLENIGGFAALKGALIDDCTLARKFRDQAYPTWIGLTRSATSLRAYDDLSGIWHMVTRTAFTQLRYSWLLLLICTVLMTTAFLVPVINLVAVPGISWLISLATLLIMATTYIPTLRYYGVPVIWSLTLPLAGVLYLLMTCHSAYRHARGRGSTWKGRSYGKTTTVL